MVLVVVADSLIARWLSDADKVSGAATDLHAYELPRAARDDDDSEDSGGSGDDARGNMESMRTFRRTCTRLKRLVVFGFHFTTVY